MITTLFKIIRLKCLNAYRNIYKSYIRDKYNVTGDICFIYGIDKKELYYMTDTTQGICMVSDKAGTYIRKVCGANKLNEYGVPQQDQLTPQLVLVPTWSMFRTLGFKKFFRFLKDWKGNSQVGDIIVIKYSVWK